MSSSWRPFASNFANHAFENYIKRHDRSETAPNDQPKTKKTKFDISELFPYKNSKQALQDRMEKFQELQKRVQRQRVLIKNRDRQLQRNRTVREQLKLDQRKQNFNQKKQMLNNIRSSQSDIPTSLPSKLIQRRSGRGISSKSSIVERDNSNGGIFSLTSAIDIKINRSSIVSERPNISFPLPELQKAKTSSLPPINRSLNSSFDLSKSLRQQQDYLLKKLSVALPSYKHDFKTELDKIHSKASITFEEHQQRNKIRRSKYNPYTRRV